MKRFAHPRQTLVFIMIAVTLMITLDVFVLKGWRPYRDVIGSSVPTVQAEIVTPADKVHTVVASPDGMTSVRIGDLKDVTEHESAPFEEPDVVFGPARENKNSIISNAIKPRHTGEKSRIVLIIDDMGVDKRSKDIIALSPPLTLAFLPYAEHLKEQTAKAKAAGHELMIHVPMQPIATDIDPGPNVLTVEMKEEEFMAALNAAFESFEGYVGINNHMGSKLTQNARTMKWVMRELKKHNLLFVDSKTVPSSVAGRIAAKSGVPYEERDVFIDHNNDIASIRASLENLEETARERGYAIAIGHPRENTVAALKEWLPTLESKGFVIVPISQVVKTPAPLAVAGPVQPPSPQPE